MGGANFDSVEMCGGTGGYTRTVSAEGLFHSAQGRSYQEVVKLCEDPVFERLVGKPNSEPNIWRHLYHRDNNIVHTDGTVHTDGMDYRKLYERAMCNWGLIVAVQSGNIGMIDQMIQGGATNIGNVLANAATNGEYNVIKILLELHSFNGAGEYNFLNMSLFRAANRGSFDIVELLVQGGATNYEKAIPYAYRYGRRDIAEMLQQWETRKRKLQ